MKIALVHDYLNQYGGAERVLEVFSNMFPDAPIYTLFYDEKLTGGKFKGKDIRTSFLQKIPYSRKYHQIFPMLMPVAAESFDLSLYDVVLSDSASFAKAVITKPSTLHICYLHTPLRYAWDKSHEYIEGFPLPRVIKYFAPFILSYLRVWDRDASRRPDLYLTNSQYVASRIRKYYNRESVVIHPPVSDQYFSQSVQKKTPEDYFLMVGRLTPYKRFRMAVEVFNDLGEKLVIVGSGPEFKRLKKLAGPSITLTGTLYDEELKSYYDSAKALIFPQEEDFGIVVLEAMAAGKPVIALRAGGALESIREGETGIFFDEPTHESLKDAIKKFKQASFDSNQIIKHAQTFATSVFQEKIATYIENAYREFKNSEHRN